MAEQGPQAPDILVPPAPQIQQQPAQQAQQMSHLNWSHFKPEFSENQEKMQKHIYLELMIG